MLVKTKAIVLSSIKFQEKSLIVKCFTLSDGLKTYFVRDAFSAKKASQKIAYFQPMTLLDIEAIHKNKGTLENFKELKINYPFQTIYSDIIKSTIVLFISEMLSHSIHEEEKNELLFDFMESALIWLDNHSETANFHLIFLLECTKYFGFYPDQATQDLSYFELTEGCFSTVQGLSSLSKSETELFKKLINLKFNHDKKIFHVSERQILLKIVIDYYGFHLTNFKKPKSVEVLKEVFE